MTDRAVLSIDYELFSQTPAYRRARGHTDDEGIGLSATDFLLDIAASHDATVTFFVVSSVAERHPDRVRALADAGHEIASHTHTHALLTTLDDADRSAELDRSRRVLERVTGRRVSGFRAPAFDLPPGHFEALESAGYGYDSSVIPSRSIPGWYGGVHDVHEPSPATRIQPDASPELAELPVSVMPGLRLPLSGAWIRFFGPRYTIAGMKLLARRGVAPVLYIHPWELVDLPAVDGVPRRVSLRTGEWMRRAVARILAQPFEFVPARAVVADMDDGRPGRIPSDAPAQGTLRPDGRPGGDAGDATGGSLDETTAGESNMASADAGDRPATGDGVETDDPSGAE